MSFGKIKKHRKLLFLLFPGLLLVFISGGFFLFAQPADAIVQPLLQANIGLIRTLIEGQNPLMLVFKNILYGIFWVVAKMAIIAVFIFSFATNPAFISGPAGIFNRQSVYAMWQFIRDFFNLFFILILLFSALCTIFQIEKYHFKKIFLNLIIMALLVNFSFPISRFMIDMANVPMYFFQSQMLAVSSQPGDALGAVLKASKLEYILIPDEAKVKDLDVSRLIMSIIFMFIFSATLLALSLLFLNRVTGLLILVIFSAVGFAGSVFPGFDKYSSMWWSKFLQYAFFGPIAMLFLLVSVRFMTEISTDNTFASLQGATSVFSAGWDNGFLGSAVLFSIPVILLWFTISMGQHFSIEGAEDAKKIGGAVLGWGKKVLFAPVVLPMKGGAIAAKYAGRKAESWLAQGKYRKWLSPSVVKEGFKARWEHQKEEDMKPIHLATGQAQNQLNAGFTKLGVGHVDKVNYEFLEQQKQMRAEEAELKQRAGDAINENTGRVGLNEAYDEHDGTKGLGSMSLLAKTNGLDNVVGDHWQRYAEKGSDGKWKSKTHMVRQADGSFKEENILNIVTNVDGTQDISVTGENYDNVFKAMMNGWGITDEETIARHKYNLGEIAKANGDHVYAERAKPDMQTGEFKNVSTKEQAENAVIQINKTETQAITRNAHGRTFADQVVRIGKDSKGKEEVSRVWGDAHELAIEFLTKVEENTTSQTNRLKPEASAALKNMWENALSDKPEVREKARKFIEVYNSRVEARRFVHKALGGENGKDPKIGPDKLDPLPPRP